MDSIIETLFARNLSQCGFLERTKITRDGYMELRPKRSCATGTCLVKPGGKNIVVGLANMTFCQPIDYIAKEQAEYFCVSLYPSSMRGIGGAHIEKDKIYPQHIPAGFVFSGVAVSFLPEFFDVFLHSRYDISPDEIKRAIAALGRFQMIPDAAMILKQIGGASFAGDIGNVWIEAKALELVSVILDWRRRLDAQKPPRIAEQDRAGILESLRYIEEHFGESIRLETLAKQAAMSVSKFTAAFRAQTGFSSGAYLSRLRMEKAMDLLKNTQASIAEVTDAVGYKYPANFCTAFLEKFGVTPGEIRKGIIKGNSRR